MKKAFLFPSIIFPTLIISAFSACHSGPRIAETKSCYDSACNHIREKFSVLVDSPGARRQGAYTGYYESGKVAEVSMYKHDKLEGLRHLYFESGQLMIEETHANGIFEGRYKEWFENGKLKQEGQYRGNEMSGVWKFYFEDGSKNEEVTFAHNEENGAYKAWFKNGNQKFEGAYKDAKKSGYWKEYKEDGSIDAEGNYDRDVYSGDWKFYDNGKVTVRHYGNLLGE